MKDDMSDKLNPHRLDFGADADAALPENPNFDAWVSGIAPFLNAPSDAPRGEMWAAILAAQRASVAASKGSVPGVRSLRRVRWILPTAIAATLLLGVGIGRFALRDTARNEPARPTVNAPSPADARDPSKLYRLVAVQTLSQAEALLTAYKSSPPDGRGEPATRQLGTWGRDVLSSTRLLIDSPAGRDPALRQLLNDLELVLVQIIQMSGAPLDASDRALIDRTLRDHDLLPRIRTAVPAGVAGTASDE